jgi:transposase-like protein
MGLAGYLVRAVLEDGGSVRDVAAAHGVSKSWLYELLARYRQGGDAGLIPRSKRPRSSPTQVPAELDERVVELRKTLLEAGLDAGAQTLHFQATSRVLQTFARRPGDVNEWR